MRTKFSGILTLLLAFIVQISFAQVKTISGNVTDDTGFPLPGVNILVKGTTTGTQSDFDGNYTLNASVGQTLVFSYVGFATQEVAVTAATSTVNIQLESDSELEQVVITTRSNLNRSTQTSAAVTISSEEISMMTPTTSLDNMLQGKAAGVQVTAANGKPGQGAFVRIRGMGSLVAGASSPLYIVDGAPIDEQDLGAIALEDIHNVEIFKDATTTAKFGSRGANGVVVITTKSGNRNREGTIRFSSRYGITTKVQNNYRMMNAQEKLQYEAEMFALGAAAENITGYAVPYGSAERAFLLEHAVDWEELMLKDGIIQNNVVDFFGGTEKMDYFFSVGHNRNTGIIDQLNGYERINSRLNVNFDVKDWLNIGVQVGYARSTSDEPRDRNNTQNPFRAYYDHNPYEPEFILDENGVPVRDENGRLVYNDTHSGFAIREALLTDTQKYTDNMTLGSLTSTIKFSDRLDYTFNLAINHKRFQEEYYVQPGGTLDRILQLDGLKRDRTYDITDITYSNRLNYNIRTDNHSLDLMGLFEYNTNQYYNVSVSHTGFPTPLLSTQTTGSTLYDGTTNRSELNLLSYGLFASYDFQNKYFVDASVRTDASSNFGIDNRFGLFYSGSVAWNIAKESFLQGNNTINDLKLRASYGTAGNRSALGRYAWQNLVAFGNYPDGATAGQGSTATETTGGGLIGNPELKWETSHQLDIGLEFGLFNNRLRGVVDYFKKNTKDLLFTVPTAHESGTSLYGIPGNIGEIENKGWEVSLQGDIVKNSNFTWTLGGNIVFLDHKIVSLPDGEDILPGDTFGMIWKEGEPINQHYYIRFAGLDPDTGRPLYYGYDDNIYFADELPTDVDEEGNPIPNEVADGRSTIADIEGGFFTNITYKGWGLRTDFVFKAGNWIYNAVHQQRLSDGNMVQDNQSVEAFNYWKRPGDDTNIPNPKYGTEDWSTNTDRFIEKGDYVRLRNVTLSYNFPKSTLENTPFSSLRLYFQGQNLLTFTKFWGDPEVGISSGETIAYTQTVAPGEATLYSYPNTRSYQFGIDVSF